MCNVVELGLTVFITILIKEWYIIMGTTAAVASVLGVIISVYIYYASRQERKVDVFAEDFMSIIHYWAHYPNNKYRYTPKGTTFHIRIPTLLFVEQKPKKYIKTRNHFNRFMDRLNLKIMNRIEREFIPGWEFEGIDIYQKFVQETAPINLDEFFNKYKKHHKHYQTLSKI